MDRLASNQGCRVLAGALFPLSRVRFIDTQNAPCFSLVSVLNMGASCR